MADQADIDRIKGMLPNDAASYGWDDAYIGAFIDAGLSDNLILATFWDKVSTSTANLVDMSESGSSRSLSQVHKNAVSMAKMYRDREQGTGVIPEPETRGLRIRQMRRV